MPPSVDEIIIAQTSNWISSVVIGCNFCPFASRALFDKTIHYEVLDKAGLKESLTALASAFHHLDTTSDIETTFIIFPNDFTDFKDYLNLVELAERLLRKEKYDGIYQIASFHPDYAFAGAPKNDAANYTNRSIYPMLHILREASITKALIRFPSPESIPERNIQFSREKGVEYMRVLREKCL